MRKDETNFIGKNFGELTIIRRVESKVKEPKWFCLCKCGKNCIVASSKLRRGQDCCTDCSRKKKGSPPNFIDLTGKRFGRLVVIKKIKGNKYGHSKYHCKCDCGNEPMVLASELKKQTYCIKCRSHAITGGRTYTDTDKRCSRCKIWKPLDLFPVRKKMKSGRDSYCWECSKEYRKSWLRKRFYGISDEEYEEALEKHNGKCAICGRHETLVIDHCHKTGKFRGLICRWCNTFLGRFKDDPSLLQKAIIYLKEHSDEPVHSNN